MSQARGTRCLLLRLFHDFFQYHGDVKTDYRAYAGHDDRLCNISCCHIYQEYREGATCYSCPAHMYILVVHRLFVFKDVLKKVFPVGRRERPGKKIPATAFLAVVIDTNPHKGLKCSTERALAGGYRDQLAFEKKLFIVNVDDAELP